MTLRDERVDVTLGTFEDDPFFVIIKKLGFVAISRTVWVLEDWYAQKVLKGLGIGMGKCYVCHVFTSKCF